MAEGKNIEIKIAATGGDQAAAEIKKVETAAETLTNDPNKSTGFGGMLDTIPERVEPATEAVKELAEATEELEPLAGSAASSFDDLAGNVERIKQIQLAQQIGQIAGQIKNLSADLQKAGPEMDLAFGSEAAGKIRDAAEATNYLATVAGAAALGFAVGGPVGGAVAGIGAALVEAAKGAYQLAQDLGAADAATARAVEMQERYNQLLYERATAQGEFAEIVLLDEVTRIYEKQSEALKGLIDQLDQARKVTAAQDKVDAAERANQDAAAIRGGAAPENVRGKTISDQAALRKKRIDEEVADAELIARQKKKIADDLGQGLDLIRGDGVSTDAQIKAKEADLQKAQEAAAAAAGRAQNRGELAPLEKAEIDNRTSGSIAELGAQKQARLKREKEAAERLAENEERKRQREELDQRQDALKSSASSAGGKFSNAGANVGGALGKTLGNIGGKLSDGTNEAEIAKLQAEFTAATQGMGGATIAAMKAMLAAQQAQAKEIEILRQQIRNK